MDDVMKLMLEAYEQLGLEDRELLQHVGQEKLRDTADTSIYSHKVFKGFYLAMQQRGFDVVGKRVLEIGPGASWGNGVYWLHAGAATYTSMDRFHSRRVTPLWVQRYKDVLALNTFNPHGFQLDDILRQGGEGFEIDGDRIRFEDGDFSSNTFKDESFDLLYSMAVLEHMADMEEQIAAMYRVLAPEGLMIHKIDLREHNTRLRQVPDKSTSLKFLEYSTEEWEKMYPPGSRDYINRLRKPDYLRLFEAAGFEVAHTQIIPFNVPADQSIYDKIHKEFHGHHVDDLIASTVRIDLRKRK